MATLLVVLNVIGRIDLCTYTWPIQGVQGQVDGNPCRKQCKQRPVFAMQPLLSVTMWGGKKRIRIPYISKLPLLHHT